PGYCWKMPGFSCRMPNGRKLLTCPKCRSWGNARTCKHKLRIIRKRRRKFHRRSRESAYGIKTLTAEGAEIHRGTPRVFSSVALLRETPCALRIRFSAFPAIFLGGVRDAIQPANCSARRSSYLSCGTVQLQVWKQQIETSFP